MRAKVSASIILLRSAVAAGVLVASALAQSIASAQAYPERPITVVVPFAAGGPTDALARVLGEHIRAELGQPVLIENVTGAGGSIGVGRVAAAAPDGYTISAGHFGTHVANGAIYPLRYDLLRDLDPVARLPSNPMLAPPRISQAHFWPIWPAPHCSSYLIAAPRRRCRTLYPDKST